jgi:hypothetical protein
MSEHFLGSYKGFEIFANLGLDPLAICWIDEGSNAEGYASHRFALGPLGLLHGAESTDLSDHCQKAVSVKLNKSAYDDIWDGCRHLEPMPIWLVQMGLFQRRFSKFSFPERAAWPMPWPS